MKHLSLPSLPTRRLFCVLNLLPLLLLPALTACYVDSEEDNSDDPLKYFTYTTGGQNLATVTDCSTNAKHVVIPATVTKAGTTYTVTAIYSETFQGHTNLLSISIPPTVNEIGDRAFKGCTKLKTITIPANITLGEEVFRGSGLVYVNIEDGVTLIPNQCFRDCASLATVRISASVENIKYMAFGNCDALKDVIDLSPTPQRLSSSWPDHRTDATLHVPAGCAPAYERWREYFKTIIDDAE